MPSSLLPESAKNSVTMDTVDSMNLNVDHFHQYSRPIRWSLVAFAWLLFSVIGLSAQDVAGVTLVHSSSEFLELDIRPEVDWRTLPGGELFPRVLDATIANQNNPGSPMELRMTVTVGLPIPEGSRLEVLSVEYDEPRFGRIAPAPFLVQDEQGIYTEKRDVNESAYLSYVPNAPAVEFRYSGVARGLHVGEIIVSPVRYTAGANKIEVVKRIRLRLRFGAASPVSNRPASRSLMPGLRASVINGDQAMSWVAPSRSKAAFRSTSVGAASAWFCVETDGEGLYKILTEDFEAVGINPSSITDVAVYGGHGVPLPEGVPDALNNKMNQVPVIVERDNGKVSRVLFYGVDTTGWRYRQSSDSIPRRVNNPYVKKVRYIVAVDGDVTRNFPTQSDPGISTVTPTYGIARLLFEKEATNAIAQGNSGNGGGRDWFGYYFTVDKFRPEEKQVFTRELIGLDRSYPVTYRVRLAQYSPNGAGTASIEQNGELLGPRFTLPWGFVQGHTASISEKVYTVDANKIASDNRSLLGISYQNTEDARAYLDWYEIHYGRKLEADTNRIVFESPTGDGIAEYRVSRFYTNNLIGLDVTDPVNPVRINPISASGGEFIFRAPLTSDPTARRRYFIGSPENAKRVSNVRTTQFADLRNKDQSTDILVITHKDFTAAAEEYVAYRNGGGEFTASFVTTEEIYTEFSNGSLDPTAIRDYVAHAYHKWSKKPRYLLLIGDGNYDYRNIIADQPTYLPIYTDGETDSFNDINTSVYDDFFVRVDGDDSFIDLAPGRIPATTPEEAKIVVEKIKAYESQQTFGNWRQRIILAADDDLPLYEGSGFVGQAESLERDYLPHWIEPRKIYLPEYTTVQTTTRTKPGATQDLLQWMNRGALLVNWVGHGNAKVWAHEQLLQKDKFIPQLRNDSILTMVMAVTCNFGRFDNPKEFSGGELFLLRKGAGAAVVLATTRAVYIGANNRLMRAYFAGLFLRDTVTNGFLPLGDALLATKIRLGADHSNDEKYLIFGDPSMRLNFPRDSVAIGSVNGHNVSQDTVTIGALSLVTVEGSIQSRQGELREDFNGIATIIVYDADVDKSFVDVERGVELHYTMTDLGGQLFRGPAIVENGRFTAQFRLPKDIAFDSTSTARMYVYAYDEKGDAAGATCNLKVYGSDTISIPEWDGPEIDIYLDDRSFRSGDVVTPTPMLIVDLMDTSGINASGAGLGHRIEAWIDENPNSIDLTEFYTTLPEDYRQGSAERELLDLVPGEYKVRVRAWDIFNNPAEATAYFRILEGEANDLLVTDVVNYPNPMGMETKFLFRHNQTRPLDVQIDIFTAGGRKIRTLEAQNVTDRFVQVPWDGHDRDGHRVANGVYFYRLRVALTGLEGEEGQTVEVIEKVAVAQ